MRLNMIQIILHASPFKPTRATTHTPKEKKVVVIIINQSHNAHPHKRKHHFFGCVPRNYCSLFSLFSPLKVSTATTTDVGRVGGFRFGWHYLIEKDDPY